MSLRDQINRITPVTFPEGKSFYITFFIDLIIENSPEYEYFQLYVLISRINLDKEMKARYNALSTFIYQKLLDLDVMRKGEYQQLMLTDYGMEIKNSGKKLSEYLIQEKENSKQKYNNLNVYGDIQNLIQDSKIEAKHIGNKVERKDEEKKWLGKFSNNPFIVGIIILALTILASYFGLKD